MYCTTHSRVKVLVIPMIFSKPELQLSVLYFLIEAIMLVVAKFLLFYISFFSHPLPFVFVLSLGQEFFAVEVAANPLVSSNETCMRLIRQAARALYNDSYPNGMAHLCRLPTQIPMKWWPRETLKAGEVVHILGEGPLWVCAGPFTFSWEHCDVISKSLAKSPFMQHFLKIHSLYGTTQVHTFLTVVGKSNMKSHPFSFYSPACFWSETLAVVEELSLYVVKCIQPK